MRIMAVDLGEKSLGLCISDSMNIIAIPIDNFFFERFNFNEAAKILLNEIEKYKDVELVLIGKPLKTTGESSKALEQVFLFLEEFKSYSNVKIKLIDERYTTQRAKELLKGDKDINNKKDVASAYVMLIDYLSMMEYEE